MEQIILNHLQKNGSITSWEAIQKYKCTRLSHYIWSLRKKGYVISDKRELFKHSITGEKSSYVRYTLILD